MTTALIIRPKNAPEVTVLECDGPQTIAEIHRYPGAFLKTMSYEDFTALPIHDKSPAPSVWELDHSNAQRVYRLLEMGERQGFLFPGHLREIRGRMKVLFPFCDEEF